MQGEQEGLLSCMVMGGLSGAMKPSFCFAAGTTVLTTGGRKAIEPIQIGGVIPCVDHVAIETAEKKFVSNAVIIYRNFATTRNVAKSKK